MKILVLGNGGREHALLRALSRDPQVGELHAAPGNAGMADAAALHPVTATDPDAVVALARGLGTDLVVVGPEAPLAAGVADALREAGIAVFGPSRAAAQLEASKSFAKEVMAAAGVPTAGARTCTTAAEVEAALDAFGAPHVVKDDGLAAGKGVVVTSDRAAALDHAQACLDAGGAVVVEDFLDGPEVSLFVLCDGEHAVALTPAQDFKRIHDGDAGPNTGGMGAYTPLPWLPEGFTEEVMDRVARPVLAEMARRGTPFTGVLFIGLAVTAKGPEVIEFNVRFGDPETQAVLARLETPLGGLLADAAAGRLGADRTLEWSDDVAVDVVLASAGYPASSSTGDVITGLEDALALEGVDVLHAGTERTEDGDVVTAGGRVLAVVGRGADLAEARERAYAGAERIRFEGAQRRSDIGLKAERGEITVPERRRGYDGAQALELDGWRHVYSGKVRDLYEPADAAPGESDTLLVVASDRISAYDHVLEPPIPDKGAVLTQLSLWWFERLAEGEGAVADHVVSTDVPEAVAGRAMVVKRLRMHPIECIARGYLTGSGLAEYREHGTVTGIPLPEGLVDGSRLEPAIFTPSAKAEVGEHDENITYEQTVERVGAETAAALRDATLAVYTRAEAIAREAGIILADTKVEFGQEPVTGELVLGDEVLTPDSSRFWDAEDHEPGRAQASFDKQFVRDWLTSPESGWDKGSGEAPPSLPADVVARTRARYVEAYERLTGRTFEA
ncbi:phosphoribosylamine--glycine ligase [Micrococcus sp.]|uniref:phosphoribosylamine--glycine ligase n=1 Tax=Micrococcus sp. TaxID=1271 RepID=UPI0026DCAE9A|nr:phosphoribosylamine--glycine ligase [Micrococcus sp.]MDO4239399.1 phosphoribosylamine--glycine ligase [Micrococcus sp.]